MDAILVLKASALMVAALGAAASLRHASASCRHQVWTLAFIALLGLPLLSSVVPPLSVPVPALWLSPPTTVVGKWGRDSFNGRQVHAGDGMHAAGATAPATDAPGLSTILSTTWIAGSLVAITMVLLSLWRVHRLRVTATALADPAWHAAAQDIAARLHLSSRPQLLVSPAVRTPMAGGLRRPVVFLPEGAQAWSHERRGIVLAHELAHLARRDPLRHVVTRLAVALYWFHPLAWLAARRARAAQEQACDETVLSLGTRASVYARVLMDMAGSPAPAHVAALPMSERPFLETRIMAILNAGSVSNHRRTLTVAALGIALLTLSVAAAQPRSTEQASTQAVTPAQKPSGSSPQEDAELRKQEWARLEAEFRAHAEWMKQSEAAMREQMRQAEEAYKAQIAAFDTQTATLRAELESIRHQDERGRSEVAETMKMLETLSRNNAILTGHQWRQEREVDEQVARTLAELQKSIQRPR